ncbi:MAG: hypothetical protein Q8J97_16065, partial [Flavobacteriaceae bacterium]|nr:hypothetical protein [Flavobacteriaceae bacterium]
VRHRDLESVLLGEATFAMSQAHAQGNEALYNLLDERRSLWVGEPFIEAIYFASDVSVSTRFLNIFTVKTGLLPPSSMLGFAVRIFSKGLARFPRDAVMELDFATVIASFCPGKTQAAMYMLERIVRSERSLPIIYRVFQRGTDIASSMLIRDSSHKKVFQLAQKMHKDALQHMVLFWNKLLADSVNIVQLGQLAKVITEKREEGYALFERVVSDGTDMHSMVRFAQFLQQVMLDHEAADVVRENVLDSLEAEQLVANGAAGGKHDSGAGAGEHPSAAALLSSNRSSMSSDRSRTIKNLSRNINSVFGILFLIIVGLFVFGLVHSEKRIKEIDTIHYAGESRTLAQETIL